MEFDAGERDAGEAWRNRLWEHLPFGECKWMFYGPDFIDLDSNGKAIKTKKRPKPDYVLWDPANAIPMAYKDPRTLITMYVETDSRHIAATDEQGKLMWVRNPWEEAHAFCPYRTPRPVVASLKRVELSDPGRSYLKSRGANLEHTIISLSYDSSQFGMLDESTGIFFPKGKTDLDGALEQLSDSGHSGRPATGPIADFPGLSLTPTGNSRGIE